MSPKAARQCDAFLRHLRRTGNVGMSAEAAGASRRTLEDRRRRHPDFATGWAAALAFADARLARGRKGEGPPVPAGAGPDAPLATGGEYTVGAVRAGRMQVRRARPGQVTAQGLRRFLDHLAATANVRLSAEAVGITKGAIYHRSRKAPDFARAKAEALAEGYDAVELALLETALRSLEPDGTDIRARGDGDDPPDPMTLMTPEQALQLLGHHRRTVRSGHQHRNGVAPKSKPEAADAALRLALDTLDRRTERDGSGKAKRRN